MNKSISASAVGNTRRLPPSSKLQPTSMSILGFLAIFSCFLDVVETNEAKRPGMRTLSLAVMKRLWLLSVWPLFVYSCPNFLYSSFFL